MSTAILENLPIKIFADGADLEGIIDLYRKPYIKGLTTNPTLMRKVGVTDYEAFARSVLESVTDKPISFEVFSDEFPEMAYIRLQIAVLLDRLSFVYQNSVSSASTPPVGERASEALKALRLAIALAESLRAEYLVQPRAPCLAGDAAAERPDRVGPAGQVSEPVQVMLHCFVTHQARHLGADRGRPNEGVSE